MSIASFDTPKSSATSRIAYNDEHKVLSVTFKSGHTEHLANVPAQHFHGLKGADSAGKYYHQHLKGKFKAAQ